MVDDNDNSNNGLITKIWGPGLWIGLHSISFGYPLKPSPEQKIKYRDFFTLIGDVLPCSYCRDSYKNFLSSGITKLTLEVMENRETLTKWLYCLHEAVNRKLAVDYGISYKDVVKRYESFRAKCTKKVVVKGCITPLDMKAQSYKNANNIDCPIISPKIAKLFVEYAKLRDIKEEEIQKLFEIEKVMVDKNNENWEKRNEECKHILCSMRTRGIPSLETEGVWKDLPTVEELRLIMRLSSNLDNNSLINLVPKLPSQKEKNLCKRIYKLTR